MANPAKRKGDGFEREIVDLMSVNGMKTRRVPLSGALDEFPGDVEFFWHGEWVKGECKRRTSGFRTLYRWLGSNRFLFFRDDHCEALVLMRVSDLAKITEKAAA